MTADVVNLRRVRKAKARADQAATAHENRARYGQSRAATLLRETTSARETLHLDGHRLTPETRAISTRDEE